MSVLDDWQNTCECTTHGNRMSSITAPANMGSAAYQFGNFAAFLSTMIPSWLSFRVSSIFGCVVFPEEEHDTKEQVSKYGQNPDS